MRPVGAFFFGRYGDRHGRKKGLTLTLVLMGAGSLGLALAPGYASISLAAPLVLIALRGVQGIGHGGEWGGASTWVSEAAAGSKRRGFWTGWVTFAAPAGNLLSSLSFYTLSATMGPAFFAYGWRYLFLTGGVVAVTGLLIRWKFAESPLFQSGREDGKEQSQDPGFLRTQWKRIFTLTVSFMCLSLTVGVLTSAFGLSYLTKLGFTATSATLFGWLARIPGLIAFVTGAVVADRKGRLVPLRLGMLMLIPAVLAYFPLVNLNTFASVLVAFSLVEVSVNFASGSIAALFTESFPTRHRNKGAGLSYHTGSLIQGSILTLVVPAVISGFGGVTNAATPIAGLLVCVISVSLAASLRVRETMGRGLVEGAVAISVGPRALAKD